MKKFYQGRFYQELDIVCEGKDVKEKLLESFRNAEGKLPFSKIYSILASLEIK